MKQIYLIGSLRNSNIPVIGSEIRKHGFRVWDDWFAAGPEADDKWQQYETDRGRHYGEALEGDAARHVFEHDFKHLEESDMAVLVLPAGKSGHLELGFMIGRGKPGIVYFPEEYIKSRGFRWDCMYQFSRVNQKHHNGICFSFDELITTLKGFK